MKKEKNHIDHLFADGLKNHSTPPPENMWSKIEDELSASKKYVFAPNTLLKYAALLSGLFIGLWLLFSQFENNSNEMALNNSKKEASFPNVNQSKTKVDNSPVDVGDENFTALIKEDDSNILVHNNKKSININTEESTKKETTYINSTSIDKKKIINPERSFINKLNPIIAYIHHTTENIEKQLTENYFVHFINKEKLQYALLEEPTEDFTKNKEKDKWQIGALIAPVYAYRSTNSSYMSDVLDTHQKSSPNDNVDADIDSYEKPIITYSAGITSQYHINNRWSIESGILYSKSGHSKDFLVYDPEPNQPIYSTSTSAGYVDVRKLPSTMLPSQYELALAQDDEFIAKDIPNTQLKQNFDFMEIPFILRYKIMDKSIDLSILTGISTAFMVKNEASFQIENQTIQLGETQNMKSVLYSSIIGLGFNFNISNSISLRFDPSFKYALHSLSKDKEFIYQPYSFNISTGININF